MRSACQHAELVCVCEACRRKGGQKPTAHVSRSVYAGGGIGISASAHQEEDSRSAGKSHYYGKPWRITLSLHACAFALTCISVPLCCSSTSKSVFNCVYQGLNMFACMSCFILDQNVKKTPVLVLSNRPAGTDCWSVSRRRLIAVIWTRQKGLGKVTVPNLEGCMKPKCLSIWGECNERLWNLKFSPGETIFNFFF